MGVIIITELIKTFLIGIFFGTFGTTIGGLIGVNLKSNSNKFLGFILSFASGLMLSLIHIYIDTKINDAKDDQTRREEVNKYSEDLKYTNATVLNSTAQTDEATLRTLADNTNMNANTAQMSMEIEYVGQENTEYTVRNIEMCIRDRQKNALML